MSKFLTIILCILLFKNLAAQDYTHFIVGRNNGVGTMWDSNEVRLFGFAEKLGDPVRIPGPIIEANEGDSVVIKFWNVSQGAPHTIHLHGLDVDQENDGVPHLSFEVGHMEHGYYRMIAPHAGTYLYHCHVVSSIHVQAGMYGLVVIRPKDGSKKITWDGGFAFDSERMWMMSEIDTIWHQDSVLEHDHDTSHSAMQIEVPNYNPQYFLVNGKSEQQIYQDSNQTCVYAKKKETVYIRLANIGYLGNRIIFPEALNAKIVASDGRPLPNVLTNDSIIIFPGERYGILLQSSIDITDSITVEYLDMNTGNIIGEQQVPVQVNGALSVNQETNSNYFELFPNPTSQILTINYSIEGISLAYISDAQGKIVKVKELGYNRNPINNENISIKELPEGTYFLSLVANSKIMATRKFVIN